MTLLATLLAAPPALAQETGVRMSASAGIGGYVDPTRPVEITVTVEADVLFVGAIVASQAATTIRVPAEVPAGTEKVFRLVLPPPVGGQQARVRLLADGVEDPVATANVAMRVPDQEVLVGLHDADGLEGVLGAARTEIGGLPVLPVVVDPEAEDLDPLGYLVVGRGAGLPAAAGAWVSSGGRLVLDAGDVALVDLPLEELGPYPRTEVEWYRAGRGEVLAVPDLESAEVWPRLLRPVPLPLAARDIWQTPERPLSTAAANSGEQRVPSLPWLLGAIVGYAALVGPVNFLVLRRVRRRDLAWVTIPALGLLALVGFWVAGRERLQGVVVNHASVLVGGEAPTGRSAVVLATGTAGIHTLGFDDGWLVYPGQVGEGMDQFGRPLASVPGEVADGAISFDLPQLGFAGAQAIHVPETLPAVSLLEGEAAPALEVDNRTPFEFWAWGVGGAGQVRVADGALAPGATDRLPLDGGIVQGGGFNIGDAIVQARQMWNDDRSWRVMYPLGEAAGYLMEEGAFFFGYTEGYSVPTTLDGVPRPISGSTLVVVPLDERANAGLGRAPAELVATGDSGWIDRGPGFLFVQTDEMLVRFLVPSDLDTDPELRFTAMFGERPGAFHVWHWGEGDFVEVDVGQALDRAAHLSASGEVVLRMTAAGAGDGIVESPMSPASVELRWQA